MSQTKELTKKQKAQGMKPVIDLKTKQPVSEVVSPLVPLDVPVEFDGLGYEVVFRYQKVQSSVFEEITVRRAFASNNFSRELPEGSEGKTLIDLASSDKITLETFLKGLSVLGDDFTRDEKIVLYTPCIEGWNVPDENGEMADFSEEAFEENQGGIHDATLDALHARFLLLRKKVTGEPEKPEASSTNGDGQSTAGETDSQTPA